MRSGSPYGSDPDREGLARDSCQTWRNHNAATSKEPVIRGRRAWQPLRRLHHEFNSSVQGFEINALTGEAMRPTGKAVLVARQLAVSGHTSGAKISIRSPRRG